MAKDPEWDKEFWEKQDNLQKNRGNNNKLSCKSIESKLTNQTWQWNTSTFKHFSSNLSPKYLS